MPLCSSSKKPPFVLMCTIVTLFITINERSSGQSLGQFGDGGRKFHIRKTYAFEIQ